MRRMKRAVATALLATMVFSQTQGVLASSKTFSPFTFTTQARNENLQKVVSKSKSDDEQAWYLTITGVTGLSKSTGTNKNGRALATSANSTGMTAPVPLFDDWKNTTQKGYYNSSLGAKKGKTFSLYVGGNSNNSASYTIKNLTGRYSS